MFRSVCSAYSRRTASSSSFSQRARAHRNIVPRDINFRIWNLSRPSPPFSVPTADTLNRQFLEEPRRSFLLFFPRRFSFFRGKLEKERDREGRRWRVLNYSRSCRIIHPASPERRVFKSRTRDRRNQLRTLIAEAPEFLSR